jgi:RNA polymerase sigma-70 factor (ECF subfamily)
MIFAHLSGKKALIAALFSTAPFIGILFGGAGVIKILLRSILITIIFAFLLNKKPRSKLLIGMIEHEDFIIDQLKEGNDSAYRYLFDRYYARLCRVANLYVNDTATAENIVGDLIFYLWESRASLDIHTSLRAYLFASVRNRCLNHLRCVNAFREVHMAEPADKMLIDNLSSTDSSPLGSIIEKELDANISAAIESLPDECRTVFSLSRYELLTYEEIAARLNISVNTVRYHIKNALSTLRVRLQEYLSILF